MPALLESRTLSISIDAPPARVYDFVADPVNLPRWATGLCRSVSRTEGGWVVETSRGAVPIRFAERNEYGVLDHQVTVAPDVVVCVPMRVVPNGSGSEVLFTLFRLPGMTGEQFAGDAAMVERDLRTLKNCLEGSKRQGEPSCASASSMKPSHR